MSLRPRLPGPLALVTALALGLVACGPDDGRRLAEPDPDLTAVTVPTTTAVPAITADPPLQGVGPGGLTLSSPDFAPGEPLAPSSACGDDVSPALTWTPAVRRVTELALVVQDIDAAGTAQWVVTGIPPGQTRARAGRPPEGGEVRTNSAGVEGWTSPCPTDGVEHRVVFTLYAIDGPVAVSAGDPASVVSAVQAAAFGSASLLARVPPPG